MNVWEQWQDITDMDSGIIPDNPIAFVFFGEDAGEKYNQVYHFWGDTDYVIYIQVLKNQEDRIENDKVVVLETESDGAPRFNSDYSYSLDVAIRRTKRHNYMNRADVDVVVLSDEQNDISIEKVCRGIYESLITAYFNHVFFEIYFWLLENFSNQVMRNGKSQEFLDQMKRLEEIEWVRFIFLISEMMNTEKIVRNKNQFVRIAIDSSILGNCSRMRLDWKGLSIYVQLSERTTVTDSKLLTIGRLPLGISQAAKKNIFCRCLLEKISGLQMQKADIKNIQYMDRKVIKERINEELADLQKGMTSVGCHENIIFANAGTERMEDILYRCFRNNHIEYMRINSPAYKEACEIKTQNYCNIQLENWLSENVCRYTSNIFDITEIDKFISGAYCEIEKAVAGARDNLRKQNELFYEWKQKRRLNASRSIRKKYRQNFQIYVLEQWGARYTAQLESEIYLESLRSMQYYLNVWRSKMYARRQTFFQYLNRLRYQYDVLLLDSSKPEKLELKAYEMELYKYLESRPAFIENCYRSLSRQICERQETDLVITDLLAKFLNDVRMEMPEKSGAADLCMENTGNQRELYSELYKEITSEKLFHVRGSICNIQPYICLMGKSNDGFIQYISGCSVEEKIVYDVECYEYPVVVYYQHIDKIEELFMHSLYDHGGGTA